MSYTVKIRSLDIRGSVSIHIKERKTKKPKKVAKLTYTIDIVCDIPEPNPFVIGKVVITPYGKFMTISIDRLNKKTSLKSVSEYLTRNFNFSFSNELIFCLGESTVQENP